MKVAVADVGTNSSHLLIASRINTRSVPISARYAFRAIDSHKSFTKLGECLDENGNINPEGQRRLAQALTEFAAMCQGEGISDLRVYATSALREAPNGQAVAKKMSEEVGIYPVIIDGQREGQLTYLGISSEIDLGADNLMLDLGGGSLEIARGNQSRALMVHSLPLGAIRVSESHILNDPPSADDIKVLKRKVKNDLQPIIKDYRVSPNTTVVLSSGTARAIGNLLAERRQMKSQIKRGKAEGLTFNLSELNDLLIELACYSKTQLADSSNSTLMRRSSIIVGGITVLYAALTELGASEFMVSKSALREGMVVEEMSQYDTYSSQLSHRQYKVLQIAEHFGADIAHASNVASLAQHIFDQLSTKHKIDFPDNARSLLTAAATLHDIGLVVDRSGHHKHSAYLIRNVGYFGYDSQEREIIALIARYHRKNIPKIGHAEYNSLTSEQRQLVIKLTSIVRVADGLDRSHSGTSQLGILRRAKDKGSWILEVTQALDFDISRALEKANFWEQAFGKLQIVRTD